MEILIILFLAISLCVTITLLFLRRLEIKKIKKELEIINSRDTNAIVKLGYPNSNLESLIMEINKTLKIKKYTEGKYKEMDMELRQAIANMSHDLRTPLTSIIGYVQLMDDENISDEERKQYLSIIEGRSQDLKELISNFYDLSRLHAEEYTLEMKEIGLSCILCELLAGFYEEFNKLNLEPEINIQEDTQLVYGDEIAVKRIFTNLIQNILKHAKGKLKISLKEEKEHILITFSNYAPELNSEDASRIFERFFTVDRMRTGQNTGLGLAITKELVEKQGQRIWAEKRENILFIKVLWKKGHVNN